MLQNVEGIKKLYNVLETALCSTTTKVGKRNQPAYFCLYPTHLLSYAKLLSLSLSRLLILGHGKKIFLYTHILIKLIRCLLLAFIVNKREKNCWALCVYSFAFGRALRRSNWI